MIFNFGEFKIDTSQEPWRNEGLRTGFFAKPGFGKSFTAAIFVEQWLNQGGTVVIIEPRAEWHTLKQKYPIQQVGGPFNQDVPFVASEPSLYAKVVVEDGVSMVFYTGDIEDEEDLVKFVTTFIHHLLRLQEKFHRPILLVVEESQDYCPRSPSGHIAPPWVYNRMIKALKDCFSQGRKLNVSPIAISQRPQDVNFTIRQLCNLVWFGGFSAQDAKYLDTEVFAPYRKQGIEVSANDLLSVETGEWLVIAGKRTHQVRVTEKRKTPHGADTPTLEYVKPVSESVQKAVSELGEQLRAMLEKRAAEESELEKAKNEARSLAKKLEGAESRLKLVSDLRSLFQDQRGDSEVGKKIVEIEEKYQKQIEEQGKTIESLRVQLNEVEALKEENQRLNDQVTKYDALKEALREVVEPMIPQQTGINEKEVEDLIDRKLRSLPAAKKQRVSEETKIPWVNMWLPKLGTAEKKIVLLLADKFPLLLTKSQIALSLGLTARGGYFTNALNNLVKWKLVEKHGEDYKLAEAPS